MSMYVDMLSSALGAWDLELSAEELIDYALDCRAQMLTTGVAHGATAYEALAAEISYDRALIKLCANADIATAPASFERPEAERSRLERALAAQVEIDLVALSRARGDTGRRVSSSPRICPTI
jgi:hypothetical protein